MLTLRIASRYFFSKKSHSSVNVISMIAIAGVAVATAAIVVVLSVFNGFERLAGSQVTRVKAPLSVTVSDGVEVIDNADSLSQLIRAVPGVGAVSPVVEERGLLIAGGEQMPVVFRGVSAGYDSICDFEALTVAGLRADSIDDFPATTVMTGVANYCGLVPSPATVTELYVPRRTGRINPANPAASYRMARLVVAGVAQSDRMDFDADHIIIPLSSARRLLQYSSQAHAIDLSVSPRASVSEVKGRVSDLLGDRYEVSTAIEQEREAFRMIAVEKWITFAILSLILIVAAFNIFSTVSLLIVEKRDNMATLRMLGATPGRLTDIFAAEGFLVTFIGGCCGIVLGVALSLAQQFGGFIKLGSDSSAVTIDVYPVEVRGTDILAVLALIAVLGLLSALISRLLARKLLR